MHISFTAIQASFEHDEYTIIASVEGTDSSLVFQRDSEQNFEDSGLYIQFGDQHNGDYECVKFCYLSRKILQVTLSRQLGSLEGIIGFDIKLEIDDDSYNHLFEGLPIIFREMPNCLKID